MQSKESNAHEMVGREQVVGLPRREALGRRQWEGKDLGSMLRVSVARVSV